MEVMYMAEAPKQAGHGRRSADANFNAARDEIAKRNDAVQRRAMQERAEREARERAARHRRDQL
jgi:hypothetical protein